MFQLVNLPEPVTLDFLDAEVEDSSKEEVKQPRSVFEEQQQLHGVSKVPSICFFSIRSVDR